MLRGTRASWHRNSRYRNFRYLRSGARASERTMTWNPEADADLAVREQTFLNHALTAQCPTVSSAQVLCFGIAKSLVGAFNEARQNPSIQAAFGHVTAAVEDAARELQMLAAFGQRLALL